MSSPVASDLPTQANEAKVFPGVARFMDVLMDIVLHGAVLLIPLVFTSLTIDSLELPKQTLLVFFASIGLVAWLGKAVAMKSLRIRRSWLNVVAVLFVLAYALVAWMSPDRYMAFVGTVGQMPWSVTTMVALLVLYFVAINRLTTLAQVYDLVFTFLLSSLLAGAYGLFQMLGWYVLPSPISKAQTFSSIGSVYSLATFLVAPMVVAAGLVFHGCRDNVCLLGSNKPMGLVARIVLWLNILVGLAVLALTDFWVAWVALLFGTVLTTAIGLMRGIRATRPVKFIVPIVLLAVAALGLWLPNPFKLNLPAEVSPSAGASWEIARQTLRDHPMFGIGPGGWSYSYALYRDQAVNLSPFWNVRFDRSFSQFLTLLASVGIVGITVWLLWLVSIVVKSSWHLLREKNEDSWYALVTVFSGWATLVFLSFFYNYNVTHITVLWMFFALLAAMAGSTEWVWDNKRSKYAFEMVSVLFVLGLIAAVGSLWLSGQRFQADVAFSDGVSSFRAGQSLDMVIGDLERAKALNPNVDMYDRNLSQAHLIKAANLIQAQPSQDQADVIQNEIKAAVDAGLSASTTNPVNVDNYSNLAALYESIASFTRGADEAAIASYAEALKREPNNPVFLGEVGKLYLLRSDAYRTDINNSDPQKAADAKSNADSNLKTAEDVLNRAVAVKTDYLPARYYLGVVYERENRLPESIQQLALILQQTPNDVNVAFELSLLLYRNGQKPAALSLMQQVVSADATNLNAKWYLSAMLEEQGKLDDAIAQLDDLAKQFPDNQAIKQRLSELQSEKTPPTGLPEPVVEPIKGSSDTNPVSR
ncbi:MAG TPA: tetratricopeptide repeat protein [Verrucomicrobiae bacterium]|nr:tetratricopeptide repeat protein [Verrucomicrobiae bacterium]